MRDNRTHVPASIVGKFDTIRLVLVERCTAGSVMYEPARIRVWLAKHTRRALAIGGHALTVRFKESNRYC